MFTTDPGSFCTGDQTQGFMQTRHHFINRAQSPLVPDSAALWKGDPWGNRTLRSAFSPAVLLQKAVPEGDPCDLLLCFILTPPKAGGVVLVGVCVIIVPRVLPG